jgi:hypothetical protein
MGFMESAVVVYLRTIYYPTGFNFPLHPIEPAIALTEFLREVATLIMLIGIGVITGKNFAEKFAYFILSFAIWDIFYYVFLKLLLNWPESLMTWDILFLVPVTWTGPVISPVIVSLSMILFAFSIIYFNQKIEHVRISRKEWIIMLSGAFVIFLSFIWDYSRFILKHYSLSELWSLNLNDKALFNYAMKYVPESFNWWIFAFGEIILCASFANFIKRNHELVN